MKHRSVLVLLTVVAAAGCSSSGSSANDMTSRPLATTTSTTSSGPTSSTTPGPGTTTTLPLDLDTKVSLVKVAEDFDTLSAFATRTDDARMFVAEQHSGKVIAFKDTAPKERVTILDLDGKVSKGNEQGLLGIVFSPTGEHLYLNYTDPEGTTQIDEYAITAAGSADPASRRNLLSVKQPFPNHNGGMLAFGRDKMLYIALGDGGAAADPFGYGQKNDTLLGKILRIDPKPSGELQYTIPSDNPFVGQAGARGEIWHYGLRNPWRFSFDTETNALWIADVGQNEYEEINMVDGTAKGLNFGWNKREGTHAFNDGARPDGAIDPVVDYSHDGGNCSVTGGYVVRGTSIPSLNGAYIYADYCVGDIIAVDPGAKPMATRKLGVQVAEPTSFGQLPNGDVLVLSRNGSIWRMIAA